MTKLMMPKDFIHSFFKTQHCTRQAEYCRQPKQHIYAVAVSISKGKMLWFGRKSFDIPCIYRQAYCHRVALTEHQNEKL